MKTIATFYSDFSEKFGIPRQSGLVEELVGKIVLEKEYRDPHALKGLESFSYLWLIWEFFANEEKPFSPTVRPPRLGGNKRVGVFASRSPFRPNRIGLSSVKLERIELNGEDAPVIVVRGADLMNGTPILDIKPYVREDAHPEAKFGFTDTVTFPTVQVIIPEQLQPLMGEKLPALKKVLENRPVPAYQNDPKRIYGMSFAGKEIKFKISDDVLEVMSIES